MNRLFYILLTIILIFPASIQAQRNKAGIRFFEEEHNFGTFRESDGVKSYVFRFINNGDLPLLISSVTSNCGCTTPEWPKMPVIPGDTGSITVIYNPDDRPGSFHRTVTVNSNAGSPVVSLSVRGVVIPVDRVEEVFKYKTGNLLMETIYAAFGEIYMGDTGTQIIRIMNASADTAMKITFPSLPPHIRIRVEPEVLQPRQEGRINIAFVSDEQDDWDFIVNRLDMAVNGKVSLENRINITANVREDFSTLTPDGFKNSPVASFDTVSFNFGNISANQLITHNFVLANTGREDLLIRKISASCGCTAVEPEVSVVHPGESTRIIAQFDSHGQSGVQKKAITVITNDPRHSKIILWIEGFVLVEQGDIN